MAFLFKHNGARTNKNTKMEQNTDDSEIKQIEISQRGEIFVD